MPEFYTRRTSGLPPSAMEYAMPLIQLGMTIKDRKKRDEDYALRKQWEEEDRALKRQQLEENKALAAEERTYQRDLDTKKEMFEREKLDRSDLRNLEADTESRRRWDIEQKRLAANDEFNRKHQNAMLELNTKIAEASKLNPMMAADLEVYQQLYKTLGDAVNNGDEDLINKAKGDIVTHRDYLKRTYPTYFGQNMSDPNMGLAQPPQRGRIPQTDKVFAGKKQVIQTGTDKSGRKVVKYADGTIEYAN